MLALAAFGLVSCNEDFPSPASPQQNLPESLVKTTDLNVTGMTTVINLNDYVDPATDEYIDDKLIPVCTATISEAAKPANTELKAIVEIGTDADFSKMITIEAKNGEQENVFYLDPKDVQDAYYNEITRNPKTKNLYMRTWFETVTDETSVAIIGAPTENYFDVHAIQFTPVDTHLVIESAYYYLGSLDTNQKYKFENSGADPYDDPIFTCVIPVLGDGWHWFKVAPASAYNADGSMNWDKETSCICPVIGDDSALSGKCENGKKSWHLVEASGMKAYKITINAMDMTYEITPIPAIPEYYMVGRQNNWSLSNGSAFYPTSGETVSYTSYFTGAWDCRISNMEQITSGNWNNFGAEEENGSCTKLVANTGKCIMSPGEGYYTLNVDFSNMTYSWSPVDGTPVSYEKIGLVGTGDDWDNDIFLTKVAGSGDLNGNDTHNWSALGVELKAATWGMKFRAEASWSVKDWGNGTQTTSSGYIYGTANGGDNIPLPEAGIYNIYFNDITGQYFFVKQ